MRAAVCSLALLLAACASMQHSENASPRKPLDGRIVPVVQGKSVRYTAYEKLSAPERRGVDAMWAASPASKDGCETTPHNGFAVSVCQDGAWICAAVHFSDGETHGHCVNGDTGARWDWP